MIVCFHADCKLKKYIPIFSRVHSHTETLLIAIHCYDEISWVLACVSNFELIPFLFSANLSEIRKLNCPDLCNVYRKLIDSPVWASLSIQMRPSKIFSFEFNELKYMLVNKILRLNSSFESWKMRVWLLTTFQTESASNYLWTRRKILIPNYFCNMPGKREQRTSMYVA